jgi:hypothetical protein
MQNKAQQGNQNPIPTPERELERYGVWVKAEPQDVLDEPAIGRKTLDSSIIDGSDTALLSEEEEDLLDSFDLAEPAESASPSSGTDQNIDEFENLSPLEDLGTIEEVDAFDLEELEPEIAAADDEFLEEFDSGSLEEAGSMEENVIEDTVIDLTLDDLEYKKPVEESMPIAAKPVPQPSDSGDFMTTEVNIEDFGFTEDGSSSTGPSLESMGVSDILESNSGTSDQPREPASGDFESLDIDLQFDDTIPSSGEFEDVGSDQFKSGPDSGSDFESVDLDSFSADEAIPDKVPTIKPVRAAAPAEEPESFDGDTYSLDSFIDDDESGANGIMPELDVENVSIDEGISGFDDVRAVSDDLSRPSSEPSSDLLQKIALELSSIKEELVSLRSQLSGLKSTGEPSAASSPETSEAEEAAPGGFFDDEDDDTIALTGDELDNILNTADFTEEPAADEALDEPEQRLEVPQDIELLPEDGVYTSSTEPGIETIELPTVEPTLHEFAELESLDGVTPITSSPEDTSFLDSEGSNDGLELDGMPLEDVPLVEPNPSDLDIIVDSAFGDEDEVLPSIEPMSAEDESPAFSLDEDNVEPELVLNLDADDKPVISTVDSFPEPLEELDDAYELEELASADDIGGMDLHSEPFSASAHDITPLEEDTFVDILSEEPEAAFESASSPTMPVEYHPDDVGTSLDDSLFVTAATSEKVSAETESPDELEFLEELDEDLEPVEETTTETTEPAQAVVAEPKAIPEQAPFPEPEITPIAETEAPDKLKHDVKSVLQYLDQLLASLPEEKIEEFASSEYYDTYKRLFDDLGLI